MSVCIVICADFTVSDADCKYQMLHSDITDAHNSACNEQLMQRKAKLNEPSSITVSVCLDKTVECEKKQILLSANRQFLN